MSGGKKKSSSCFQPVFYFSSAGQKSNQCHRVCDSCRRCLLLVGLAPEQIQRETVLMGHRDELRTGQRGPGWVTWDSLWPQLPLRFTNNCVPLSESSTSLFSTSAFISLPVMISVVVWECLQANSHPHAPTQCSAEDWCRLSTHIIES